MGEHHRRRNRGLRRIRSRRPRGLRGSRTQGPKGCKYHKKDESSEITQKSSKLSRREFIVHSRNIERLRPSFSPQPTIQLVPSSFYSALAGNIRILFGDHIIRR